MDHRSMFTDHPATAPSGPIEALVAHLWQEALQVQPVGRDDNFFEMGGTSMVAVRICATVEKAIGVRPATTAVFDADTLADFAIHITDLLATADSGVLAQKPAAK